MNKFISWTLFGVLAMSATSCLEQKENDDQVVDYGPQSTLSDIGEAYNQASEGLSYETMEVGQYVYFKSTQQALGTEAQMVGELYHSITKKDDLGDRYYFEGEQLERELMDGNWTETLKPFNLVVLKAQPKTLSKSGQVLPMAEQKTTFHNLTVTTKLMPPPKKVVLPLQQNIGAPCEPVVKAKLDAYPYQQGILDPDPDTGGYRGRHSPLLCRTGCC